MRRADRLFQIIQILRSGRLVTGRQLAERLEVSPRTIYRDVVDLKYGGVPIEGEAGLGYVLREGFDLPPLMFTRDEIVALVMGARLVRAWGGVSTARAAEAALQKIESVLPQKERSRVAATEIHAFEAMMPQRVRELFDTIEQACESHTVMRVAYRDLKGSETERVIRPLGLWFWGKVWTLVAWCELRDDFRVFRLDRIGDCTPTGAMFEPEPGKDLRAFCEKMEADEAARGGGCAS
ncbi:DeoR family transcriptional regulator [Acidobacteria bacterium Mor1]|nr:DeoR family transcriptional regulator [Acidobacteria bacterium Mor1]